MFNKWRGNKPQTPAAPVEAPVQADTPEAAETPAEIAQGPAETEPFVLESAPEQAAQAAAPQQDDGAEVETVKPRRSLGFRAAAFTLRAAWKTAIFPHKVVKKIGWDNRGALSKALTVAIGMPLATAVYPVGVPLAGRVLYTQASVPYAPIFGARTKYDCIVNQQDALETKTYGDSPFREFMHFPVGYMAGLRDTFIDHRLKLFTSLNRNGDAMKFLLHAQCRKDGTDNELKPTTFEITDTFWRSQFPYRSGDMASGLGFQAGKQVKIEAAGIRWGGESWFENVMHYTPVIANGPR